MLGGGDRARVANAQAFHQGPRYNRWFVLGTGSTPGCRLIAIPTMLMHPRWTLGVIEAVQVDEIWEVVPAKVKFS